MSPRRVRSCQMAAGIVVLRVRWICLDHQDARASQPWLVSVAPPGLAGRNSDVCHRRTTLGAPSPISAPVLPGNAEPQLGTNDAYKATRERLPTLDIERTTASEFLNFVNNVPGVSPTRMPPCGYGMPGGSGGATTRGPSGSESRAKSATLNVNIMSAFASSAFTRCRAS